MKMLGYGSSPTKENVMLPMMFQGRHRKKLAEKFPKKKYHRRSIIENMFFCVKRLCGNVVRAKKWVMQRKEMLGKILAYNIHRLVQLLRV